jgi:streptogramin lyase
MDKGVHCVNWEGTEVISYKIPNEHDHRKIAIDRNGNVYVVGSDTNIIQRLHSDGTVDCVVLNETYTEVMCSRPC